MSRKTNETVSRPVRCKRQKRTDHAGALGTAEFEQRHRVAGCCGPGKLWEHLPAPGLGAKVPGQMGESGSCSQWIHTRLSRTYLTHSTF